MEQRSHSQTAQRSAGPQAARNTQTVYTQQQHKPPRPSAEHLPRPLNTLYPISTSS